MKILLATIRFAAMAHAQDMPRMRTWKASVATLGVSRVLDIASTRASLSRGNVEMNPLGFSGKSIAVSVVVVTGAVLIQRWMIRRYPETKAARTFALVNFGVAGATTVVAGHNWSLR